MDASCKDLEKSPFIVCKKEKAVCENTHTERKRY